MPYVMEGPHVSKSWNLSLVLPSPLEGTEPNTRLQMAKVGGYTDGHPLDNQNAKHFKPKFYDLGLERKVPYES